MSDKIFEYEENHLNDVLKKVDVAIKKAQGDANKAAKDRDVINKNYYNDVKLNTSTYSGMMDTAVSIRQQQQMLSERENSWKHATKQIDTLNKMKKKPYFARIDFHEEGEDEEVESIYIGLSSFTDTPDHFLIYDWRAPISSVYYDGKMGKVQYSTPDGLQDVNLKLKRQFSIEDGKLLSVYDTDETIGDQMLLNALGSQSDVKMKSIVTTIQREQNKIIRNTSADLLFVQGAAGSGKTAAILQRVAFLLYRYRGKLNAGQVIMFSPNQLFNDYVDQVLPELGEQNMIQMTYYQFARRRVPNFDVENLQKRFDKILNPTQRTIEQFKGSLNFFKAVTRYSSHLLKSGMRFRDIMFHNKPLITKQKIKEIYYSFNDTYTLANRIDGTKEALMKIMRSKMGHELRSKWVEEAVQNLSQEEVHNMFNNDPHEFQDSDEEFKFLAKQIIAEQFKPVHKAIMQNRFLANNAQYIQMLRSFPKWYDVSKLGVSEDDWNQSVNQVVQDVKNHEISMVDTSAYLYLYDLVTGKRGDRDMRYVFIDEIQDYNAFQLAYLRFNFPRAKFTLLGDLNQSIYANETSETLLGELSTMFNPEKTEVVQLSKSYRSTKEITDFTKEILQGGESIEAFNRDGELPQVVVAKDNQQMVQAVVKQLKRDHEDGETSAIIGRSLAECEQITSTLQKDGQKVTLIRTENQRLVEGIIVVPSFLAKGLEFDSVIVWNANDKTYQTNRDEQLLYTICSRAMHRLLLVADQHLSPLVQKVPSNLYELK